LFARNLIEKNQQDATV